jgi:transposase
LGEVFYRSFDNRKQLASYVGLTPAHFQSGSMCRDQGISKAGNAKARTVMIELAWLWLRHQPDSPLSVWFRDRVGKLKGRIRRITNRRGRTQAPDRALALSRDRSRA